MAHRAAGHMLHRIIIGGVLAAALLVLFSAPDGTAHAAGTFNATTSYFLCNQLPSGFSGPAVLKGPNPTGGCSPGNFSPNANPNFGYTITVPKGDYQFATIVNWMSDGFTIAADAAIDNGTVVGGIRSATTLGLLSNPCSNTVFPDFILYDSTTNTANTVDALPEGTPDRFSNLKTDLGDAFDLQADANSPAVIKYPSFLNTLLDPDLDASGGANGPKPPISPHARYTGLSQVGGTWIFLAILIFQKSQLLDFTNDPDNATHPLARYGANPDDTGWVHLLVLQDPTELVVSTNPISDFCTPLVSDVMYLGQVTDITHGTVNRLTSPAANTGIDGKGTHLLLFYGQGVRDADGDGLENSFDTCPWTANTLPAEDPRVNNGPDNDMLDSVCDPTPATNSNFGDHDLDGFQNSQDNCPLVVNVSQAQAEQTTTYVLAAPDAGFKHDSIGDACDSESGGNDSVANGAFLHDMNSNAVCIGGTDTSPADGFCDSGGQSAAMIDTDGDIAGTSVFTNNEEVFMQTDPLIACPITTKHAAWPPDFDNNKTVNILDIVQLTPPVFNSSPPNPNYKQRKDLDANGTINILDIVVLTPPVFNTSC